MHPPGGSTKLVVELPAVPAATAMLLEGGIRWELAPRKEVTPLRVGVEDAKSHSLLGSLNVPGGVEGLQKTSWGGSNSAGGMRIWTQSDSAEARDACVELLALSAEAPH
jgi:hypothetical protein